MNDKLTAYALNELPPEERAALEQQMANDPALREEAEAMKAFCGLLHNHVGKTEDEELTGEQRNEVLKAFLTPPRKVIRPPFWKRAEFISTAIAAGLALTLLVPSGVLLERKQHLPEAAASPSERVSVEMDHEAASREKDGLQPQPPASLKQEMVGKKNTTADPAKPSLGDLPATPLAMPAPVPAPITAPTAPGQGGRFGSGQGIGSNGDLKKQPSAEGLKTDSLPNDSLRRDRMRLESSSAVQPQSDLRSQAMNEAQAPDESKAAADKPATATKAPIRALKPAPVTRAAAASPAEQSNLGLGGSLMTPEPQVTLDTTKQKAAPSPAAAAAPVGTLDQVAPAAAPMTPAVTATAVTELEKSMAITTPSLQRPLAGKDEESTRSNLDVRYGDKRRESGLSTADPISGTKSSIGTDGVARKEAAGHVDATKDRQLEEVPPTPSFGRRSTAAGETYTPVSENPFQAVAQEPLSTFSIDVDTASYANVRRFLNNGQRPPGDAVRLEELINYFPYAYEGPSDDKPFAVHVDIAEAPWKPEHRLARIALKGRVNEQGRGPSNFVFLVDVSGSMDEPDKLPLVKKSLLMLTERLGAKDRVALVTYAGSSGVVLPSTTGSEKSKIVEAIEGLGAGGSTNGAGGIRLAYEQALKHFQKEGVNRVILCTDGDFNVGISSPEELEKLIAEKAKSRVFLSVLGFGTGNLKDRTMETLADRGNGNYAYIDSLSEARKVLVEQMNATLVTIAKDVKIQVEFNPRQIQAYRLLGYENRVLAKQDFNNDRKDAGEIGEGHTVTALYELVPADVRFPDGRPLVDALKYAPKPQPAAPASAAAADPLAAAPAPGSGETMTVKLRYKQPLADTSVLVEVPVTDKEKKLAESPADFKFAASVAGFGMLLRNSPNAGELTWDMVRQLALTGKSTDELGYRGEFLQLIDKARGLVEERKQ